MRQTTDFQSHHIQLITNTFQFVDTDHDGHINKEEAMTLIRYLGQTLSNKELDDILHPYFHLPPPVAPSTSPQHPPPHTPVPTTAPQATIKKIAVLPPKDTLNTASPELVKALPNALAEVSGTLVTKITSQDPVAIKFSIKPPPPTPLVQSASTTSTHPKAIDLPTFLKVFKEHYTEPISLNQLVECFKIFDTECLGQLSLTQVGEILTYPETEPLSAQETQTIFSSLHLPFSSKQTPSDCVDYVALAERMIYGDPKENA